jgi:2-polyprenyl-3-methyl-5-hydroxy-6-metoxy-1,4-benzoquinol methylase
MTITVRILIADDHRVVRQRLRMFLTLGPEIEVVGEEESHEPATALAGESLVVHASGNSLDDSPRSGGDAFAVHAIEKGAGTVEEIARAASISLRGAQALLDSMVALELVQVADGKYKNSPEASFYLVEGKPAYLGTHAKMVFSPFGRSFLNLPEVAKTGVPEFEHTADVSDNPFWEELVLAIVPLALPVTHALVERLDFSKMAAPSVLDIGGGSGIFSVVLLEANKTATATQIDWAAVNRIGERFVARHGVADRFKTIDGNFHTTDLGDGLYDVIIYSNIAHQESPADNTAMFRKAKNALKPGGVFVISDFVLNDDRTPNHPWTGIFHTFMLLQSKAGAT